MKYSEIVQENNRFLGTTLKDEYKKWIDILDEKLIRYKSYVKEMGRGNWDFRIELIGYTKEENEKIKDMVGFYYDEEDAG